MIAAAPIMISSSSSFDIKGKKSAHRRALYALETVSPPSSPESSTISSDNDEDEDEHYFSDVSTGSSSTAASSSAKNAMRSSPKLGDFVFDSEEEYEDYFAVVRASVHAPASVAAAPKPKQKKQKKYRKGTSSFFLSGAAFPQMPQYSSSISAQNPAIASAAAQLQQKIQRLKSLSSSASSEETPDSEEVNDRFERALRFAQWSRSQQDSRWQAPAHASEALRQLVESAQQ